MNGTRPDWVMAGFQSDGKFCILASTKLTQAELNAETEIIHGGWYGEHIISGETRYDLTVTMTGLTIVTADSYEAALRTLLESWTPTEEPAQAITARAAIEGSA